MENIVTRFIKFHRTWENRNICLILLIISLHAETTSKGTCVNERGECCTNFYRNNGKCIACPPGTYGDNCTTSCPYLHYGENCGLKCECSSEERCDSSKGCVSITTSHVIISTPKSQPNTETTDISVRSSSDSTLESSTTHVTENKETSANTTEAPNLQVSTISTSTVGSALGSVGSDIIPVIIITGTVLSLFLIIIIINQVHEKIKRHRKATLTTRALEGGVPEEETYVEINESSMLRNTSGYNMLAKNQPKQKVSEVSLLPDQKKNINKEVSPETVENCSDYLDVVHVDSEERTDGSYLNPVTREKCNSYLEVVGTPPENSSCTEIGRGNQNEQYQELD